MDYAGGVSELSGSAQAILTALDGLNATAAEMQNGYSSIKNGVNGVFNALSPFAPPELAAQMAQLQIQMDVYGDGLIAFFAGLGDITDGMAALCDGISA